MKIIAVTTIVLVCLFAFARAQNTGDTMSSTYDRHFLTAGAISYDVGKMNTVLGNVGIAPYSPYFFSLSLGSEKVHGRLLTGGSIEGENWIIKENDSLHATFWTARLMVNTGLRLLSSKNVHLYPIVGAGTGYSFVQVAVKHQDFADALAQKSQTLFMQKISFLVNAALEVDLLSNVTKTGQRGILGIRAGYLFDPIFDPTMNSNGTTIRNAPVPKLQGPYVRLVVGDAG